MAPLADRRGLSLLLLVPAGLCAIAYFTPATDWLWPPDETEDSFFFDPELDRLLMRFFVSSFFAAASGVAGIVAVRKRAPRWVVWVALLPAWIAAMVWGGLMWGAWNL